MPAGKPVAIYCGESGVVELARCCGGRLGRAGEELRWWAYGTWRGSWRQPTQSAASPVAAILRGEGAGKETGGSRQWRWQPAGMVAKVGESGWQGAVVAGLAELVRCCSGGRIDGAR
ncbi:hypothetical protein CYMTET_18617 [Cymbomonas tetramitiformis]|uniref:Uncharacterized protein n=1 Tax=Cymbomonas tetramitiformis TaxID=36881 RepID=A0AAE0G7Y7_9CHLO|nr:hypothetical protein CYMTET_18617 [Cymbomonas tetramitiformis]